MLPDNGRTVKQCYNYHMTPNELKILIQYVKQRCDSKYLVLIMLMAFRGLRPSEATAANIIDFKADYTRLTFREAKTNKIRFSAAIVSPMAKLIKTYVELNKHRLIDGWLFPAYTRKLRNNGKVMPHMDRDTFRAWFHPVRKRIAKHHPSFDDKHTITTPKGNTKVYCRIQPYSCRRFFETYFYVNNKFNLALLKEVMEYSSKFDPMKHYIKICHTNEELNQKVSETFTPFVDQLISGQKLLGEFTS